MNMITTTITNPPTAATITTTITSTSTNITNTITAPLTPRRRSRFGSVWPMPSITPETISCKSGNSCVIGAFIASICQTVISRHAFLAVSHAHGGGGFAHDGPGGGLNLCSGADAFVAASFKSVLPMSAQMGFMVLGPMLDLKLSAMYLSFIRKRAFIVLVFLMYCFVFALMMFYQHFIPVGWK